MTEDEERRQATDLLLVDDDARVGAWLAAWFGLRGFAVRVATDAASARACVEARPPRVAILDVRLPGEDGLSLARWLRTRHPGMGLVFLAGDCDAMDRVAGLESGGDDYVAKPCEPRELLARVQSVLRRLGGVSASHAGRVRFGDCVLDVEARTLCGADGRDIPITPAEFDLLALFARSPNRPLGRDEIMQLAYLRDRAALDRSIDLRILRLRRKLERDPAKPQVIKTVRNAGYVFVSDPWL